jgi:hypothetical protein
MFQKIVKENIAIAKIKEILTKNKPSIIKDKKCKDKKKK